MIIDDTTTTESGTEEELSVSQLETRFSIARDAITNEKKHVDEALRNFLRAAGDSLTAFRIDGPGESGLLDERVLKTLVAMRPCRDYFLELVHLSCNSLDEKAAHKNFRGFLGEIIALKQPPLDIIHFNHLWCDHYRFFVRELFLCTIAMLLRIGKYDVAASYLQSSYTYPSRSGQQTCNFLRFDAYIKSLDEFRARRLSQQPDSVAADLLRERIDLEFLSYDDIMQADFLLCVYGLLHYPGVLTRWCPRTLIHAGAYEENGFDMFARAESLEHFGDVATVLDVRDRNDLSDRFQSRQHACYLDQWKMNGSPIPFNRYMRL